MSTILLVEDNPHIMHFNSEILAQKGYNVQKAATVKQARDIMQFNTPDLIVLDIMLPDGSGLALCEELRGKSGVPILFLSAKRQNSDIVAGLKAGGDDYLAKPYDLEVLCARIGALLRRVKHETPHVLTASSIKLDCSAVRAYINGCDMCLTPKEFIILRLLAQSFGRTVSRESLCEAVWGSALSDDGVLKKHISTLRSKLENSGCIITAVRGEGYCLEENGR